MNNWQNIVKTATLGTNRSPFKAEYIEEWQKELLANAENDEDTILQIAGMMSVARKAGYQPETIDVDAMDIAPDEELPYVSSDANYYFKPNDSFLLELFLDTLISQKRIIQPHLIPQLLESGIKHKIAPHKILNATGKRGEWFLQFHPKADYFTIATTEDWETGDFEKRLKFIEKLRQTKPDEARTLIEETIRTESVAHTQKLLEVLHINISQNDEEFLNPYLKHKRIDIQQLAHILLGMIPESAMVQTMKDLADLVLTYEKKVIKATLPKNFLDEIKKVSTLKGKVQSKGLGEKAKYLAEIISYIPPSYWEEKFNLSPQKIVDLSEKTLFTHALLVGWAYAANNHKNSTWLSVILEKIIGKANYFNWYEGKFLSFFLQNIEEKDLEAILLNTLAKTSNNLNAEMPIYLLISAFHKPLSDTVATAFFDQLKKAIKKQKRNYRLDRILYTLKAQSHIFPVSILAYFADKWKEEDYGPVIYRNHIHELLERIETKKRMIAVIQRD